MTAGEQLNVTQHGTSGPRVVFLHGLFGQGRNWTTVAKALSDSARVSLVDLPNHGRSAWTEEFSYPGMADLLADLLTADGGGEAYAVVGHSMGGKVAMALALRHRRLVDRLCVSDVSPVSPPGNGLRALRRGTPVHRPGHARPTGRLPTPSSRPTCRNRPSAASCCRTCAGTIRRAVAGAGR